MKLADAPTRDDYRENLFLTAQSEWSVLSEVAKVTKFSF